MKKLLLIFGFMLAAFPASAATVYVSQSGGSVSCGADGTQSTTAIGSLSWTASNTYKLCGTITQDVVVGADSVSIIFESNASIQVGGTGCGNGCIQLNGHNSGLIDGGTACGANTTCANNVTDYGFGSYGTGYILQTTAGTPPQSITSISCSGGIATATGSNPFGYNLPNEPQITVTGNSVSAYNGTFTVLTSLNSGNTFTYAATCGGTGTGGQAGVLCPSGSYCSASSNNGTNMIDTQNSGGCGWEIRNLIIGPFFLNVTSWTTNNTNPQPGEYYSIYMTGCTGTWNIHDLTEATAGNVYTPSGSSDNKFTFHGNQLNGMTVGLAIPSPQAGSGSELSGAQIYGNVAKDIGLGDINPTGQGGGPNQCNNHTSFLHSWALNGVTYTGENIYNNEIKGNGGSCLTGGIFLEGDHLTTNLFGNFFHMTYTQNSNGIMGMYGDGPFTVFSNTIIGAQSLDLCFSAGDNGGNNPGPTALTFEGNVATGCNQVLQWKPNATTITSDHNGYGCDNNNSVSCPGGFVTGSQILCSANASTCANYYSLAQMVSTFSIDGNSKWNFNAGTTGINTSTGAPASSTPGSVAAANLASLCTGLSISGNPCLTDIAGNGRGTSFTVGAFEFAGTPAASQPVCTPGSGTYLTTQSVTCTSTGSVICSSTITIPATNGTTNCATGTLYTGAISVSSTENLNVIGGGTGTTDSTVANYSYTISASTGASSISGGVKISGGAVIR